MQPIINKKLVSLVILNFIFFSRKVSPSLSKLAPVFELRTGSDESSSHPIISLKVKFSKCKTWQKRTLGAMNFQNKAGDLFVLILFSRPRKHFHDVNVNVFLSHLVQTWSASNALMLTMVNWFVKSACIRSLSNTAALLF